MIEEQLRVLLVDDEASLREPLAKFLRDEHSCAVDTAADGERAWDLALQAESSYQVALIDDLLAPNAEEEARPFGIELMKRIKSHAPQTEVIIFTGWGWGLARAREALQAGAFRYLAKTVDREELALTIRQAAEFQRLKGDAREKQILEQLMKTSAALLNSRNQEESLNHILQGIQAIGFDRARLYLLADDGKSLVGKAQVGMDERFIGLKWPITDDWHTQTIITGHSPRVFKREDGKPLHSEEGLDKEEVDEWADVPLMLRGEVIGKLSADNKYSHRPIVAQELTPIALFASQAAATIELNEQKDQLERLFASSPNGIIAVDAMGNVTSLNKQAEDILGYRAGEVLGKPVEDLYFDPKEPRKIGKMLHLSAAGRVANYETFVKSKDGQKIPIRHSSTWLYDANGKRIGSVGYFEDRRPAKERERRIELLLKANNIVAQAENMDDGLKSLAQMIVTLLDTTFCRIFLLDESNRFLVAKAVSLNPRYGEELDWNPSLGERTAVAEWEGLSDTLANSGPFVLRIGGRRSQMVLEEWSSRLGLKKEIQSLLVIPLRTKNGEVGLLDVGELRCWEEAPFSEKKIDLAAAIAGQIVALVDRIRLHEIAERRSQLLRSCFVASNTLVSSGNPQQTLQEVVEQTRIAADASWVRLILIDEKGQKRNPVDVLAVAGEKKDLGVESVVRSDGLSVKVLRTGEPEVIEDTNEHLDRVSPFLIQEGSRASVCLPLSLQGERIGVVWIHYDKPRHFSDIEIDAWRLYVNHAAIAYDGAQQMEELERLSQAAQSMSKVSDLKQTLQTIVEEAVRMFGADFSTIWSYDFGGEQFLPEELAAVGYSEEEVQKFKEKEPQLGHTTYTVLEKGWISVHDISSSADQLLKESSRELLKQKGIGSFQCVALRVGDEPIGALYASYKQPRTFGEEDRRSMEKFAAHAALSLRNAKLLDQLGKAKTAAMSVARMTTLEDHNETLNSITIETQKAVRCDAVVLYDYNQATNKLDHAPTMVGVWYEDRVMQHGEVLPNSFVYKLLERTEPYIVEKINEDDLFKDSRFAREEEIKSCMAITLKAQDRKVGVMFVNYRIPHRFTSEELADIKLFAFQAAVAIRNAQLFEDAKRLSEQEALVKLSKKLLGTVNQQEMLDHAVAVAADVLATDLASTILPDKSGNLILTAAAGCWKNISVGETRFEGGKGSHAGFTILEKVPVKVDNYAEEKRFAVSSIVSENCIRSGMSAPMFSGNDVVGAMFVYTRKPRHFTEAEETFLSLVANQTAIALKSAQQFKELKETKGLVGSRTALAWTGMISSAWRHTIEMDAITIREEVQLLRSEFARSPEPKRIAERMAKIERLANRILEKPITPPLSVEEEAHSFSINALIRDRTNQLWNNDPYKSVKRDLKLGLADSATTRASPEWLRRCLDVLIDNAVDATVGRHDRRIIIASREVEGEAKISVMDNGKGISEEVAAQLFREPVKKLKGAKGLGIGLLFAQTIVQTYGGDLRCDSTGPTGTTMTISLPLET